MLYKTLLLVICFMAMVRLGAEKGKCPLRDGVMVPLHDTDNVVVGTRKATVKILGQDDRVLAPVDGRVRDVFFARNNVSIVRDTATFTCYGLDSALVKEGQLVKAGQLIGLAKGKRVFFFVSNYSYTRINATPQVYVDCVCRLPQP